MHKEDLHLTISLKSNQMHYVLHKTINIDRRLLIRKSYIPCIITTICVMPLYLINIEIYPIIKIICYMIIICTFSFVFGLANNERKYIINLIKSKIQTYDRIYKVKQYYSKITSYSFCFIIISLYSYWNILLYSCFLQKGSFFFFY